MALKDVYRFPSNLRARKTTAREQADYIIDEAYEAYDALFFNEGDDRIIEETWDVIQAAEGLLRKFPLWKVIVGLARVKIKSLKRGDYEVSAHGNARD